MPQGGEGLFARVAIPKSSMICFYNGIRLRTSTHASQNMPHSDYRIRLNADLDLDIPDDCISLDNYCATLGHKVKLRASLLLCEYKAYSSVYRMINNALLTNMAVIVKIYKIMS